MYASVNKFKNSYVLFHYYSYPKKLTTSSSIICSISITLPVFNLFTIKLTKHVELHMFDVKNFTTLVWTL